MRYIAIFIICAYSLISTSQEIYKNPLLTKDPVAQQKWTDSIYDAMSLKERVGQLFMVQVVF